MQVETSLHELVNFMFIENKHNSKIYLDLPSGEDGIRDNHDMFTFLLDLLCKGLVTLYGDSDKKIALDNLTSDQMAYVTKKLLNAGVKLHVTTKELIDIPGNSVLVRPGIFKEAGNDLIDYSLRLVSKNTEYTLKFELVRI